MGKKDSKSRVYFSDPERFADLFNGLIFDGNEVIRVQDLQETAVKRGDRTRDIVRKVAFGTEFVIMGLENQETVDYSMPVRIMESDLTDYKYQVNRIKKETDEKLKAEELCASDLTAGEFLYKYPKNAKIYPVVTIILSNDAEWDGPGCLRDMLCKESIPKELFPYVSDYRLNIIDIPKLTTKDTSKFKTDLKEVFDVFRSYRDYHMIQDVILQNKDRYQNIDAEAYELINEYVNFERLGVIMNYDEGGCVNMRNGFDDWADEIKAEGIKAFIDDKLEDNAPRTLIKARIIKRFDLTDERADEYMRLYIPADYEPA